MCGMADLRTHGRRRLDRFEADLEETLDPDGSIRRTGLRISAEVEMAMYERAKAALEQYRVGVDRGKEER